MHQNEPEGDGNEGVLRIPQISSIIWISLQDTRWGRVLLFSRGA